MRIMLLSMLLGITACAGPRSVRGPAPIDRAEIVPAGTPLVVELDEPVSLRRGVGTFVRGRTVRAVRGPYNEVMVPRGARVHLRVVDRGPGPYAAVWLRAESIEMGGRAQRLRGEIVGASMDRSYGRHAPRPPIYRDRSIRGDLPRGTVLELQLTQPIYSIAAVRSRFY
jgi:hypothetical protein